MSLPKASSVNPVPSAEFIPLAAPPSSLLNNPFAPEEVAEDTTLLSVDIKPLGAVSDKPVPMVPTVTPPVNKGASVVENVNLPDASLARKVPSSKI